MFVHPADRKSPAVLRVCSQARKVLASDLSPRKMEHLTARSRNLCRYDSASVVGMRLVNVTRSVHYRSTVMLKIMDII